MRRLGPKNPWKAIAAASCALVLVIASLGAGSIPSAGSREHAFFIWPTRGPQTANMLRTTALRHIPASEPLGTVREARQLPGFPAFLASWGDRVLLVHEPEPVPEIAPAADGQDPARPARRVESVTVARSEVGAAFFEYRPIGRDPEALPSLPASGHVLDTALTVTGAFALMEEGGKLALLRLQDTAWAPVATPPARAARAPTLISLGDRLLVAERAAAGTDAQPARIWSASDEDLRVAASESGGARPVGWTVLPCPPPQAGEEVFAAGDSLVACSRTSAGQATLRLLRPDGSSHVLASVAGVGADYAIVPVADRVNVLWFQHDGPDVGLKVKVISAITGRTLFEGWSSPGAVVSARSLLTLALLLGAVMLTALVFILRPEPADTQVIVLPPGTALAGPGRRFVAAVIDIGIPALVISRAFHISAGEILSATMLSADAGLQGAGALLALLFLTMLHTSLSEWLAGSTLGKRLVGCRTASIKGTKPALWQAVVRNSLKLLCPPLSLFLLVDPRSRHPADVLAHTMVLVVVKRQEPHGPGALGPTDAGPQDPT